MRKTIKLSENDLRRIIQESIKTVLTENKEGRNMKKARNAIKRYCRNVKTNDDVWIILNEIRELIPFSRIYDSKYLEGVIRLVYQEELEFPQMEQINAILEVLSQKTELAERYDSNFNGIYYDDLRMEFFDEIRELIENEKTSLNDITYSDNGYTIIPIKTFEEAQKYSHLTEWCITKNKFDFETYTNGNQSFYFCLKNGYEKLTTPTNSKSYLDEYGLSMIAVSVYSNGRIASSTTRWNEGSTGNKSLSPRQISEIIGKNFFDVFVPFG